MRTWQVGDVMTQRTRDPRTGHPAPADHRCGHKPSHQRRTGGGRLPPIAWCGVRGGSAPQGGIRWGAASATSLREPTPKERQGKGRAAVAYDLMTSPAVTTLSDTSIVAAAKRMDRENVKRLPAIEDLGRLVGIVTRRHVLKVHLRPDDDSRGDASLIAGAVGGEWRVEPETLDNRWHAHARRPAQALKGQRVQGPRPVRD